MSAGDRESSGAFGSALAPPLAGVRWTREFGRLDAEAPCFIARSQIEGTSQRWFLVVRAGGFYLYVYARAELLSALAAVPDLAMPLWAGLDLHEHFTSTQLPPGQVPVAPDPLPDAAPSRARFVEMDDQGAPVAVGGVDVDAPRRMRGRPAAAGDGGAGNPGLFESSPPPPAPPPPAPPPAPPAPGAMPDAAGSTPPDDDLRSGSEPASPTPSSSPPILDASNDRPSFSIAGQSASGAAPAAAPSPAPSPMTPRPLDDEGTTPLRHPSIEPETPVVAGAPITLVIDLTRQASTTTQGGPLTMAPLPATWETMALGVTVVAAGITFDTRSQRAEVVIQRNRASIAARIAGTVDADLQPGDTIEVHAQFWQGRRCCGSAVRVLTVQAAQAAQAASAITSVALSTTSTATTTTSATRIDPRVAQPTPHVTTGTIAVDPQAEEPDLTVFITLFDPKEPGSMHWRLQMPDFDARPAKLDGRIDLGRDPRAEAVAMFKEFALLKRGEHAERIEGFGARLWKRSPDEFKAAYWALVDHLKRPLAIQFVSDDPYLPWELMCPSRDGQAQRPLAIEHAVARWIGAYQGWLRNRLPAGEVLVVAPHYPAGNELLMAEETAARVVAGGAGDGKPYRARVWPGTRAAMLELLERPAQQPTVSMLYFTGHGLYDEAVPTSSALKLEQGSKLAADEIDRDAVQLGARDGTVVFFNACEVGATGGSIGEVGGWASALAARKFRAFIAPLWAVDEEDASAATLQLIDRMLVQRRPIGAALRELREQHGATSPTFYSYILYGDVTARFAG